MERADELLIEQHISHDDELRKAVEEHRVLEGKIAEYNSRIYLTPEEELEKKTLQKRKLLGKEKIFLLLAKYRGEA
ncbi:MAG: DUF465 domain-containing protein [Smithellaceae bacterium]|nr:DUF465 domain-containing protein [Smithellaceae bacterium]